MRQLLYASSTSRDLGAGELDAILASARWNNQRIGVTGMLLHADGGFMQVLEGDAEVLDRLYATIAADKRHWDAHVILNRDAPRAFGDWSMGFRRLKDGEGADATVFEITRGAIENRLDTEAAQVVMRMLATFYRVQTGALELPGFG